LFILPEILLPWLGANDWLSPTIRENLFPDDQYWKAYGFILAWPLMAWNVFTNEPNAWWLIISAVQTFVIIPLLVWRWGKGAYCGWICSCGALAETLGDRHREKMPHGHKWNKLNFVGQIILATAFLILVLHIISWTAPSVVPPAFVEAVLMKGYWKYAVDFFLAGALGVGLYFWLSGRVWCRFACPLAALMHIYARFSQFRIIVEQKKCISCNACTTVCHQGIDVMNFANKGQHMEDPQCVRCSACVQICPTGVLQFGSVDGKGAVIRVDSLAASPVLMREQ
jgi:polyferredoxin